WPGFPETLRLARPPSPQSPSFQSPSPVDSGLTPSPRDLPLLLTACAAADGDAQVADRRQRHPAAAAEDMEGYGVALACALAGVPLAIVRGIANRVGDRATAGWAIGDAL